MHWFLRHPPLPDMSGRCYGRLDITLPAETHAAAARYLREDPTWTTLSSLPILSSPARRCIDLARALSGLDHAVVTDDRLLEMHFGAWEGLPWDRVPRAELDQWGLDVAGFRPPGGENFHALVARVAQALAALERPHLIVTHAGVVRAAQHLIGGHALPTSAAWPVAHLQPLRIDPPGGDCPGA